MFGVLSLVREWFGWGSRKDCVWSEILGSCPCFGKVWNYEDMACLGIWLDHNRKEACLELAKESRDAGDGRRLLYAAVWESYAMSLSRTQSTKAEKAVLNFETMILDDSNIPLGTNQMVLLHPLREQTALSWRGTLKSILFILYIPSSNYTRY